MHQVREGKERREREGKEGEGGGLGKNKAGERERNRIDERKLMHG